MYVYYQESWYYRSGGEWLVTNMRRGESVFEIDTDNQVSNESILLCIKFLYM